MSIHPTLEKLYFEDLEDQKHFASGTLSELSLIQNDNNRMNLFKKLIGKFDENEIWNCHYACLLLMHARGDVEIKNYKLAHSYAKKAVDLGSNVTKWLYAASLDRLLVAQGKKQLYGTQFIQKNEIWELCPVDSTLSDEEREKFGVPPLSKALEVFKAKYDFKSK